jgi:hypothetical protein
VRVTIYHAPFHTNDLFYSSTRLEPFKGVVSTITWTSSGWQAGRDGGMAGRARRGDGGQGAIPNLVMIAIPYDNLIFSN